MSTIATPSSGRDMPRTPAASPAMNAGRHAPVFQARVAPSAVMSANVSESTWLMKLIDSSKCHGEIASRRMLSLARPRSASSCTRRYVRRMHAPPSSGFTSHGTPSFTPTARTRGHPGGKTEYHRSPDTSIRNVSNAAGTGGAGNHGMPAAK